MNSVRTCGASTLHYSKIDDSTCCDCIGIVVLAVIAILTAPVGVTTTRYSFVIRTSSASGTSSTNKCLCSTICNVDYFAQLKFATTSSFKVLTYFSWVERIRFLLKSLDYRSNSLPKPGIDNIYQRKANVSKSRTVCCAEKKNQNENFFQVFFNIFASYNADRLPIVHFFVQWSNAPAPLDHENGCKTVRLRSRQRLQFPSNYCRSAAFSLGYCNAARNRQKFWNTITNFHMVKEMELRGGGGGKGSGRAFLGPNLDKYGHF